MSCLSFCCTDFHRFIVATSKAVSITISPSWCFCAKIVTLNWTAHPGGNAVHHERRSDFWGAWKFSKVLEFGPNLQCDEGFVVMWSFSLNSAKWLHSAPYKISKHQPLLCVLFISLKPGKLMEDIKMYKKVSWSNIPNPTGSQPF